MKKVLPIRDKEKIREMKRVLKGKNERNYILFMIGINTGLRISDILPLRVQDVKGDDIELIEIKTNKERTVTINDSLRKALDRYIRGKKANDYLIKSREGINQPVSADMAYKIIRSAAEDVGLKRIGTHSMRKTFGYNYYQNTKNIEALREMLGHSTAKYTRLYIGIEEDFIREQYKKHTNL